MTDEPRKQTSDRSRRFLAITGAGPVNADELLPVVYEELRALARAKVAREASSATLQPTMLVHEAWLRLVGDEDPGWNGRSHFLGAAAQAMRRILVDRARKKARLRHGGDRHHTDVDLHDVAEPSRHHDLIALDEAVRDLEAQDPRKGRIVELRYFAGLTARETAAILDVSIGTVERDWRFARSWLKTALENELPDP